MSDGGDITIRLVMDARETLRDTARDCRRKGGDEQDWLFSHAPQWALDAVTQREVDAVIAMTWGGL